MLSLRSLKSGGVEVGEVVRKIACAAALSLLSGCASIIRGTIEQVQFDSDPAGATMRSIVSYECGGPCAVRDERPESQTSYVGINDRTPDVPGPACITPCAAQVARNQELIVTFSKEGYETQTLKLSNHLAGGGVAGAAGNILLGGAIGAAVDVGDGAVMDHYPNPLRAILTPLKAPPAQQQRPQKRQKTSEK